MVLTQAPKGIYHQHCEMIGIPTFTHVIPKKNSIVYFLRHTSFLIRFCRKNKIDVVYAHLETAGLPAVLAQYFIKARVFACRHVIDEPYLFKSKNFIRLTRMVYKLARHVIVVSDSCKRFMIEKENIAADKIKVIYLAYNFKLYQAPVPAKVEEIRRNHPCKLLLITACRLVKPKRTEISISVVRRLLEKGLDVKLLILGSGPYFEQIKAFVALHDLQEKVFMLGFQLNMMDYLSASDVLVHPSISDSSSVIIKETGLNEKPVVVCRGIGDVDDYLMNNENAFLVSKDDTENEMEAVIERLYHHPELGAKVGKALNHSVIERFAIEKILPQYNEIHKEIENSK